MVKLSPDLAETDPARDELGYAPLAKSIALGIEKLCPAEGIVMAITGGWGVGKTTTINFVRSYLIQQHAPVEVVEFNPWWFSGHEDLVRRLINSLAQQIKPGTAETKRLSNAFHHLTKILNPTPLELQPHASGFTVDLKNISISTIQTPQEEKDVPSLKKEIGDLLQDIGIKFLVIVDDVDRLSVDEIRDLFRAIKAIGDLPNVVYLLALDPSIVSIALNKYYPERSNDYIEKMLQVTFDLPLPSNEGISRIVIKGLDQLLLTLKIEKFDNPRFWLLNRKGLRHLLTSPRQAVRLLNALYVTLPAVVNEVDIPEFIAIESCRMFLPEVYQKIRMHKDEFVGIASRTNRDGLKAFHNGWLESIDHSKRGWIKEFLIELFPKLDYAWNDRGYDVAFLSTWRKELRVCSPEIFDVYFSFAKPVETISAQDLREFLNALNTSSMLATLKAKAKSDSVHDKNWLWNLLERLRDHTKDEITPGQAEALFAALISVWAEFRELEGVKSKIALVPDNSYILSGLLKDLLTRIVPGNRKTVILTALKCQFSIDSMSRVIHLLASSHGKFQKPKDNDQELPLVTADEFEQISYAYCTRMQELIDADEIQDSEDLCRMIYAFAELSPERLSNLIDKLKQSTLGAVALMSYGSQRSTTYSTKGVQKTYEIDLNKISSLLPYNELMAQAEVALTADNFGPKEREIAKAFIEKVSNPRDKEDWENED